MSNRPAPVAAFRRSLALGLVVAAIGCGEGAQTSPPAQTGSQGARARDGSPSVPRPPARDSAADVAEATRLLAAIEQHLSRIAERIEREPAALPPQSESRDAVGAPIAATDVRPYLSSAEAEFASSQVVRQRARLDLELLDLERRGLSASPRAQEVRMLRTELDGVTNLRALLEWISKHGQALE